jgi:hypothetical protein
MYNVAFPVVEDRRKQKDREKPWLDDPEFKVIVREKGELYTRKVKRQEREGDWERLAEVTKKVNRTRQRLRRTYFSQRLEDRWVMPGPPGRSWESVGGRKKKGVSWGAGFFRRKKMGLTGKAEVEDGFYSQVGPKLAAKVKRERESAFMDYMSDRVGESLFWRPTTPLKVEELCGSLGPHKSMGCDEVSPRVIKMVAH